MTDSTTRSPVIRWRRDEPPVNGDDDLASEEPMEIRVAGRGVGVTMRTPGDDPAHDEELALGFLVGEGVIAEQGDVLHVRRCDRSDGDVLDVLVGASVTVDFAALTRHVFASSSCGICGAATIELVRKRFPAVDDGPRVNAEMLLGLVDSLRAAQPAFDRSGGLHAAGLFDASGRLLVAREDIGRHNAVDKIVGHALRRDLLPLRDHLLLVSGRASFEIVQKALAAGIPIVAAVSAPSSLAVDLAEESNITLVGFLRPGRFNVYAHPQRIGLSRPQPPAPISDQPR